MMIPLFKENADIEGFDVLERKMIRTMALHRELQHILALEYEAGKACRPKELDRLLLRKKNSVNRFEHLVRSINEQLNRMAYMALPKTAPRTLVNRVKVLLGLTPELEATLVPLARSLEAEHRKLIEAARRNTALFKDVLGRYWVAGQYASQGE